MRKLDTKKARFEADDEDLKTFREMFEAAQHDKDVRIVSHGGEEVLDRAEDCNLHKAAEDYGEELLKKAYVKEHRVSPAECLDAAARRMYNAKELAHVVEMLGRMPKGTSFVLGAGEAVPDSEGRCGPDLSVTVYLSDLCDAMRLLLRSRIAEASGELAAIEQDLEFDSRWG